VLHLLLAFSDILFFASVAVQTLVMQFKSDLLLWCCIMMELMWEILIDKNYNTELNAQHRSGLPTLPHLTCLPRLPTLTLSTRPPAPSQRLLDAGQLHLLQFFVFFNKVREARK